MAHIHAELIKAWLEGEKIQRFDSATNRWEDVDNPKWLTRCKYRVRTEPKIRELYMFAAMRDEAYEMVPRYFENLNAFCRVFEIKPGHVKRLDFTKIEITV